MGVLSHLRVLEIAAIRQRRPGVDLSRSKFVRPPLLGTRRNRFDRARTRRSHQAGWIGEGPPLHALDFQVGILAGLWGFVAAASSASASTQGGAGRSWSLSIFESNLALSKYHLFEAFARRDMMRRIGVNRFWPNFPAGKKVGSALRQSLRRNVVHSVTCSAY